MTARGSMSDFDDAKRDSLKRSIAAVAGVDASAVTVAITGGSVLITATIAVPTSKTAEAVQTSLANSLGDTTAASNELGITVESVPSIAVTTSPATPVTTNPTSPTPSPPPPTPPLPQPPLELVPVSAAPVVPESAEEPGSLPGAAAAAAAPDGGEMSIEGEGGGGGAPTAAIGGGASIAILLMVGLG